MKLAIVAVGQRLPAWAQTACDDYARRLPAEWKLSLKAVKTEPRTAKSPDAVLQAERSRIEAALPRDAHRVVLDERGTALTTLQLAQQLRHWQDQALSLAFIMGGPDGLAPELRDTAAQTLRLSHLTLPHALARVLLLEQLYRAWSVNTGHPYHRE